jgi:hypothetical protein
MRWLGLCLVCGVVTMAAAFTAQGQQSPAAQGQQPAPPRGQQTVPAGETPAKFSIKDVMENAHKAGLLKKVLDGQASQEEKLTLLDHYVSLTESQPALGSPEGWREKSNAVVVAAAKVAVGRDDGTELLKAATNCAACHKEHKPPTP